MKIKYSKELVTDPDFLSGHFFVFLLLNTKVMPY